MDRLSMLVKSTSGTVTVESHIGTCEIIWTRTTSKSWLLYSWLNLLTVLLYYRSTPMEDWTLSREAVILRYWVCAMADEAMPVPAQFLQGRFASQVLLEPGE